MPPTTTSTATLDELRRRGFRHVVVGGAVLDEQLDGTTEEAAPCVDVVDHHLGDVDVGDAHEGKRAGLIGDEADPGRTVDRVVIVLPPHAP